MRKKTVLLPLALLMLTAGFCQAPAKAVAQKNKYSAAFATSASDTSSYFIVEDYFKVKWGHAEEFIALWKANHYPLLKNAQQNGDVISIKAESPRLHSGEETRWDFRVTVVFKTAALAFDENLTAPYKKQLYPDEDAFKKAEQQHWEIILAHWDVEVANVSLD